MEFLEPHYQDDRVTLFVGDSRCKLPALEADSVDAVVTDAPYEFGFMGKDWDRSGIAYNVDLWRSVLRCLKPGGHLLAFGGPRTYHRLATAIEDAGFEIRDQLQWLFGSGFPKSLDISKAIDKQDEGKYRRAHVQAVQEAGLVLPANSKWDWTIGEHSPGNKWWKVFCEWLPSLSDVDRERVNRIVIRKGFKPRPTFHTGNIGGFAESNEYDITAPTTDDAKQWNGWGTNLKPANEPICLARKPIEQGLSIAQNVLKWGTGALNIARCRIAASKGNGVWGSSNKSVNPERTFVGSPDASTYRTEEHPNGRWPANVIHDGSDEVLSHFPHTASGQPIGIRAGGQGNAYGHFEGGIPVTGFGDKGSAARFFYCAKAAKSERNRNHNGDDKNHHPTVKPVALMQYLCRLITPPNGIVLDPFSGSGSTGIAALIEGFRYIGIDLDAEYIEITKRRLKELQPSLI